MNITCPNFNTTELYENPYMAIDEWNNKYGRKPKLKEAEL